MSQPPMPLHLPLLPLRLLKLPRQHRLWKARLPLAKHKLPPRQIRR